MARWLAWIAAGFALAFASLALLLVELNGGDVRFADTTGSAILAISFSAVGAVITARRPGNPIGWVLLIGGFFNSLNAFSAEYPEYALFTNPEVWPGGPFVSWLGTWSYGPGAAAFPLILLLFPTGRLPSSRWRPVLWLITVGVALIVVPMAVATWSLRGPDLVGDGPWAGGGVAVASQQIGTGSLGLTLLASVVCVVARFRRAAGIERQQLKWLLYAAILTFAVVATVSPAAPFEPSGLVGVLLSNLAFLALPSIPAAIGIAILRYRLYDIDLVINRTLVYGLFTISLVVVYVGSVVVLQGFLRLLTGQNSQLAVVASTLVIAALFAPLRRRIQEFIDRLFYRSRYDARKTLEAFSITLRDKTNLETLNNELVGVARETMQPEHVSLWLRPDAAAKGERSGGST